MVALMCVGGSIMLSFPLVCTHPVGVSRPPGALRPASWTLKEASGRLLESNGLCKITHEWHSVWKSQIRWKKDQFVEIMIVNQTYRACSYMVWTTLWFEPFWFWRLCVSSIFSQVCPPESLPLSPSIHFDQRRRLVYRDRGLFATDVDNFAFGRCEFHGVVLTVLPCMS